MSPALTPAQPAPQEYGGAAAAPAEPGRPSRAALPAGGRAKAAPRRPRGRPGPAPRTAAREVASPTRGLPTRVNKAHAEWGWRPGRAAPSSRALRPPSRAQSLGARGLPPTPRRPPARRYLVGAPPPGPRPAPCAAAAAALFWRRFNSRPREKLSLPGDPAPRVHPEPWRGRGPRASPPRGAIVCAARPPARRGRPRQGPRGSRARPPRARRPLPPSPPRPCPAPPPARGRASERAASRGCHTQGRPAARDPPRPPATPPPPPPRRPGPFRPTRPPSGLGPHTTGFPHSAEGRADSPGGVAATIFASPAAGSRSRLPTRLRFTTTGGPRPGVRPADRPAPPRGFARGASRGYAAGVVPTPSASPEGAKWREGAGRAATAAPLRAMWVNEGRRLPPQRKYGQAPLPH